MVFHFFMVFVTLCAAVLTLFGLVGFASNHRTWEIMAAFGSREYAERIRNAKRFVRRSILVTLVLIGLTLYLW